MTNAYDASLNPSNWTGFQIESGPGVGTGGTLFTPTQQPLPAGPAIPGASLPGSGQGLFGSTIGSGGSGGVLAGPGATSLPNTAAAAPTAQGAQAASNAAITSGPAVGSVADYFARAIIVVLGFIFIAMGLNMLRPGTVPVPVGKG